MFTSLKDYEKVYNKARQKAASYLKIRGITESSVGFNEYEDLLNQKTSSLLKPSKLPSEDIKDVWDEDGPW